MHPRSAHSWPDNRLPSVAHQSAQQHLDRARALHCLSEGPDRVRIWHRIRQSNRMNDSRSLIRYSQRSSDCVFMARSNRTFNISTWSNAGRPPFIPFDGGTTYSRSKRNISKSTNSVSSSARAHHLRPTALASVRRRQTTPAAGPRESLPTSGQRRIKSMPVRLQVFGGVQLGEDGT
jgi:hypothetical protein